MNTDGEEASLQFEKIADPVELVLRKGGVHDTRIDKVVIDTDIERLSLFMNDLNACFTETEEYTGCEPAIFIFEKITELRTDLRFEDGIRISNLAIFRETQGYQLEIDLNLGGGKASGGRASISAKFVSLSVQHIPQSEGY